MQIYKRPTVKITHHGSRMLSECSTSPRKLKTKKPHPKQKIEIRSKISKGSKTQNFTMRNNLILNGSDLSCSSKKLVKCTESKSMFSTRKHNCWRDRNYIWIKMVIEMNQMRTWIKRILKKKNQTITNKKPRIIAPQI